MKYQKKTRSTSSQKIAKINEKEFWDLFHQVHNKHLTSSYLHPLGESAKTFQTSTLHP
jgi:hypothetical protein